MGASMTSATNGEKSDYGQRPYEAPPESTEVVFVRHGQSAPYRDGEPFALVDGQGDPPLSDLGQWQAQQVSGRLATVKIAAVYVTNLQRTAQTAAPLLHHLKQKARIAPDLREVHLGDWEGGLFRKRVAEGHPVVHEIQRTQNWGAIPGAETAEQLRIRVVAALEQIHLSHPGERVVVVSHGGAIGAALSHATGSRSMAFSAADNASISHLVITGDRWLVRRFNDTGHLDGELSSEAQGLT